jgi:hypothetical protein
LNFRHLPAELSVFLDGGVASVRGADSQPRLDIDTPLVP